MSEARALFQSHLMAAVGDAQAAPSRLAPVASAQPVVGRPIKRRLAIRLWLPLTPLWVLLAPFALVFAPALKLAPGGREVRPYGAVRSMGAVLMALSGTRIHVETPDALIHIRIL